MIYFFRRRTLNLSRIPFFEEEIEWYKKLKFQGLTEELLWNKQVQVTVNKASRGLVACRRLADKNVECTPTTRLWMDNINTDTYCNGRVCAMGSAWFACALL